MAGVETPNIDELRAAIQALQAQRDSGLLDGTAGGMAIEALREQLQVLERGKQPAQQAERKQITVLFSDLSGFSALSEKEDAEEVRSLINECFDKLGQIILRYGGHIDKFIGDELMALFGAPIAMEDHASRALYASLELRDVFATFSESQRSLRVHSLSLHMGINSGLVVAGAIGTETKREYTVMGDPVNIAARLVARAGPGDILVGENTRRLAGDEFDYEDLGSLRLEGRAAEQRVYRVRGVQRGSASRRRPDPLTARHAMVGRQAQLRVLQDAMRQVAEGVSPKLVEVVGAAGIGKSRLRDEFRNWLVGTDLGVSLLEGSALSRMATTPYFPIADLLRKRLGVTDADSASIVRLRLEAALHEVGIDRADAAHALAAILAVDYEESELKASSAEERRNRIFEALASFLRAISNQGPVLLLLNDLHWADDLSVDVLQHVCGELNDAPILFVTFARPILDPEARPRHVESADEPLRLSLEELDEQSGLQLLLSLAPGLDRWPAAVRVIMQKAQGNPFFLEEIVHSLMDQGALVKAGESLHLAGDVSEVTVPDTVWGVLAERIDRLPMAEKLAIQGAAIVGRVFWQGAVEEVTRSSAADPLEALRQREFVGRLGPAAFAEDWEWTFRHVLVQEVAYSGLLHETRRAGHLSAARWLEHHVGDRLPEFSTVLAQHYQEGEDWQHASQFAEAAGDRASNLFAHSEARAAYLQSLDALSHLESGLQTMRRQIDITLKLARESSFAPTEEVFRALETAGVLALEIGEVDRQVRVLVALAGWQYVSGQARLAVDLALQAVSQATQAGLEELLVVPYLILGRAMFLTGDYGKCVELTERAQDMAVRHGHDLDQWAGLGLGPGLALLGAAYQQLGDHEKGRALGLESINAAESRHDLRQIAIAHLFLGSTESALLRFADATDHLERAAALCEATGDVAGLQTALGWLGRAVGRTRDLSSGAECLDRALRLAEDLAQLPFVPFLQAYRAELHIMAGELPEAAALAAKAVELARVTRQQSAEGEAHRVLAWALHYAEGNEPQEVLREFERAISLHRSTGARILLAITLFDLARYLVLSGRAAAAAEPEQEASMLAHDLELTWLPFPASSPPPAGLEERT